jgi:ribokinase
MIGCVGRDAFADTALSLLRREAIDLSAVAVSSRPTCCASVWVDAAGENAIVVASGANQDTRAAQMAARDLARGDWLMLQMEVPPEENWKAVSLARAAGARIMLSAAPAGPIPERVLQGIDVLLVNRIEGGMIAAAVGLDCTRPSDIVSGLTRRFGFSCIMTLGAEGAICFGPEGGFQAPALPVTPVDTAGAGDIRRHLCASRSAARAWRTRCAASAGAAGLHQARRPADLPYVKEIDAASQARRQQAFVSRDLPLSRQKFPNGSQIFPVHPPIRCDSAQNRLVPREGNSTAGETGRPRVTAQAMTGAAEAPQYPTPPRAPSQTTVTMRPERRSPFPTPPSCQAPNTSATAAICMPPMQPADIVVRGYFTADPAPDGNRRRDAVSPEIVDSFTVPSTAGRYAQLGAPASRLQIGGSRSQRPGVRRPGGRHAGQLGTGDPSGATWSRRRPATRSHPAGRPDDLRDRPRRGALDRSPSTRRTIPASLLLDAEGVFIFTSGLVAKKDPSRMTVNTPVALIGIRGTVVTGLDDLGGQFTVNGDRDRGQRRQRDHGPVGRDHPGDQHQRTPAPSSCSPSNTPRSTKRSPAWRRASTCSGSRRRNAAAAPGQGRCPAGSVGQAWRPAGRT